MQNLHYITQNPKKFANEENPNNIAEILSLASHHYYNTNKELM